MAVKRCKSNIDVVAAAKQRVFNIFKNGVPVYLSFSGGKDSLCLAHIVVSLIQEGKIDASQLTVQFIDEEAIYPCMEQTTLEWRKKFLLLGAKFEWFCIEVRHYNCFNELTNDESFICWDRYKEDVWIRKPPSFAIRSHPMLRARKDTYQDFLPRISQDGLTMVGVRVAESIQRLVYIAGQSNSGKFHTRERKIYPIYDWTDKDVWLYLKQEKVKIPEVYLYLWQVGVTKRQLRVSQFFSIDTSRSLVQMNEYYPDLMDRIIRREPNAYLAALYWDSEMFGRRSRKRKELEGEDAQKDYKAELLLLFNDMDGNFPTKHKREVAKRYWYFFLKISPFATNEDFKSVYDGLVAGDPKLRNLRALYQRIFGKYVDEAKKADKGVTIHG